MAITVREHLMLGPATSKELQAAVGLSQPQVSRELKNLGDSVIRLRHGRIHRYAATKSAFGADDCLLLCSVDAHGDTVPIAYVRPLAHGGYFVKALPGTPWVLLGVDGDGLYDDLPYFLDDQRPQGFIGRQIAQEIAAKADDFPADPREWNTDHVGRYLISNGDDLPGDLKFGPNAILRMRNIPKAYSQEDYPDLAQRVMEGVVPGSSAGGEQPKFSVYSRERARYVIVKFSPKGDNAVARRWRDILVTEFHATEVLHSADAPAAETRLIEADERLFLESNRFDRAGEYGRRSMISLQAVDAEFIGDGGNWLRVMSKLCKMELVVWAHLIDTEFLWHFGRLINNTDMHLGNLSLRVDGDVFRLLPAYDMCSMGFAPKSSGEVSQYRFTPPELEPVNFKEDYLADVRDLAIDFWKRVMNDPRISDEFRSFIENDFRPGHSQQLAFASDG